MSARDGEEAASDSTLARSSRVEGVTKKTKLHTFALLFVFTHDVSNNSFLSSLDMYMEHKYCLSQSVCLYCYVVTNISCIWRKFVLPVAMHEHRPSE